MDISKINEYLIYLCIIVPPYLMAVTIHEVSHAYAAYLLGDNTAKNQGRLTLNPIAHIDMLGLFVLIVTRMFGWAKPVPIDYGIVSKHKKGLLIVSIAGPLSNFAIAIISAILLRVVIVYSPGIDATSYSGVILYYISQVLHASVIINVCLGVFNMLPIPPLDGSKIVSEFLPYPIKYKYLNLEKYGLIIILFLLFINVLQPIIYPVISFFNRLLLY